VKNIFKIILSKYCFKKPPKKRVLIYDKASTGLAYLLFQEDECEILHVRYETINLIVLILTFLKKGFRNIADNYKLTYSEMVEPEVIFSDFTNNYAFFKLKNFYQNATYICIHSQTTALDFFNHCDDYYNKDYNKLRLKADIILVPGNYYKKKFSKYIDGQIITVGSFKNNYFYMEEKKTKTNINSILFISQVRAVTKKNIPEKYMNKINNEVRIVKALESYCEKKKLTLNIAAKNTEKHSMFYKKNFGLGNWNIFHRKENHSKNFPSPYNLINDSFLVVFTNSTLGLESLVKGKRAICFPPEEFPIENHEKKFSKQGPFWSEKFDEKILEQYLQRVIQYTDEEWGQIVDENIGDLMTYDPKNSKFVRELNKLKVKTLIN